VYAGAGRGGMQAEAGLGVGAVGNLGAAAGFEGRVGLAGGDDLDAARAQQGPQADAEGEGEGFFLLVTDGSAGVVAAVGCVKNDDKARGRGRRSGLGRGCRWEGRCLCDCGQRSRGQQ